MKHPARRQPGRPGGETLCAGRAARQTTTARTPARESRRALRRPQAKERPATANRQNAGRFRAISSAVAAAQ